jgi:hypothetical protein
MANPFDQFDDVQAGPNPFDKFDASEPKKVGLTGLAKAGLAGANKGFYSDLLGLPVDAVINAADLLKAGVGYPISKLTGNAPPSWLEADSGITKRSNVVGSSEWLARKINDVGLGGAINNPNPDDAASRILYTGGRFVGSSVVPSKNIRISGAQQARNAGMAATSGALAGSAAEINPDAAGPAGMLPSIVAALASRGTKQAVRGGEAGRKQMAQRVQDFKNAGIDEPSVGLASGNRLIQGAENLLSLTPGSVGLYEANKQDMLKGIQNKTNQFRDEVSPIYGNVESGMALQKDLKALFKKGDGTPGRFQETYNKLIDRVENAIGENFNVATDNSINSATKLSTPISGAEQSTKQLILPRIEEFAKNLRADAYGSPLFGMNANAVRTTGGGIPEGMQNAFFDPALQQMRTMPNTTQQNIGVSSARQMAPFPLGITSKQTNGTTANYGKIPFSALKQLRTNIGEEARSTAIQGTPEQSQFKRLYGAMSEDMRQGVNAADRVNAGIEFGPLPLNQQQGTIALNRANKYYSNASNRAEDLNNLANRSTPEGAYSSVANSLKSGPTTYERLRNVVSPQTRGKIVASVIDDLGKSAPGQQGVSGDAWSPRSFLTNYNKLDDKSKTALFTRLPGGKQHADNLQKIAKAADMIDQGSKIWSNPSGTAAASFARGTGYALSLGAFIAPMVAAGTAGSLAVANQASQRLLLNPKFVNWLSQAEKIKPEKAYPQILRLIATSKMSGDKQFQQDVNDYVSAIKLPEGRPPNEE